MDNNHTPPKSNVTAGTTGSVSNTTLNALNSTKPWVLLVGIVSLLGAALVSITAVTMLIAGSRAGMPNEMVAAMTVFYVIIGVVSAFFGIYLVRYSSSISRLMISREAGELETALMMQKSFWKLTGIITLISVILTIIAFIGGFSLGMRGFRMF